MDQSEQVARKLTSSPTSAAQAKVVGLTNLFPIPLKKQNQATIGFARLPLEKADLQVLKQWIDLMAENLTEEAPPENPS